VLLWKILFRAHDKFPGFCRSHESKKRAVHSALGLCPKLVKPSKKRNVHIQLWD
jgi:hypothetical protein